MKMLNLEPSDQIDPTVAILSLEGEIGSCVANLDTVIEALEVVHVQQGRAFDMLPISWQKGVVGAHFRSGRYPEALLTDDNKGFFSISLRDRPLTPIQELPPYETAAQAMLERGTAVYDIGQILADLRSARLQLENTSFHSNGWTQELKSVVIDAQQVMSLAFELSGLTGDAEGHITFSRVPGEASIIIRREFGPRFGLKGRIAEQLKAAIPPAVHLTVQTKPSTDALPRGHQEATFFPLDTYLPLIDLGPIDQMNLIRHLDVVPGDLVLEEIKL